MGLDRIKKVPCGFAFVEFRHRIDALGAVANLTGTKLDGMLIRVELDAGFKPGREYGRGTSGGQVRDDRGGGAKNSGRKRQRSEGEGGAMGEDQQKTPRFQPPQQFGARWESPAGQGQNT
jgi:RNA recognition motif-containing protein